MKTDTLSVLPKIKKIVIEIDPSAEVFLYGSRARGDDRPDSDLDLLILVDAKTDLDYERIFRHRLYDIELESGIALSTIVQNKTEWKLRYWMTPLYINIASEGKRI